MSRPRLTIVDYGMGNLRSVIRACRLVGDCDVVADAKQLADAGRLVLPGIGHFRSGMRHLAERGFIEVLNKRVKDAGVPVLGICLGMQLLTRHSEEGDCAGLGWLPASTRRLPLRGGLRVPHMGWNTLQVRESPSVVTGTSESESFYFVHSYEVVADDETIVAATTQYGGPVTACIQHHNVVGVQFHPEKSHAQGIQLLRRFAEM